jgi:hypothetical protein
MKGGSFSKFSDFFFDLDEVSMGFDFPSFSLVVFFLSFCFLLLFRNRGRREEGFLSCCFLCFVFSVVC